MRRGLWLLLAMGTIATAGVGWIVASRQDAPPAGGTAFEATSDAGTAANEVAALIATPIQATRRSNETTEIARDEPPASLRQTPGPASRAAPAFDLDALAKNLMKRGIQVMTETGTEALSLEQARSLARFARGIEWENWRDKPAARKRFVQETFLIAMLRETLLCPDEWTVPLLVAPKALPRKALDSASYAAKFNVDKRTSAWQCTLSGCGWEIDLRLDSIPQGFADQADSLQRLQTVFEGIIFKQPR